MGVTFDLVDWAGTGADFSGVYARLNQFAITLPDFLGNSPEVSSPAALFFVSIADFSTGKKPLTVLQSGYFAGPFAFPLADENAMRQTLDPQLFAVIEQLPGYVPGSAVIVVDPPAPPPAP